VQSASPGRSGSFASPASPSQPSPSLRIGSSKPVLASPPSFAAAYGSIRPAHPRSAAIGRLPRRAGSIGGEARAREHRKLPEPTGGGEGNPCRLFSLRAAAALPVPAAAAAASFLAVASWRLLPSPCTARSRLGPAPVRGRVASRPFAGEGWGGGVGFLFLPFGAGAEPVADSERAGRAEDAWIGSLRDRNGAYGHGVAERRGLAGGWLARSL